MKKRRSLFVFAGLVALFLAMQVVTVEHSNPPVLSTPAWDSPQTLAFAKRACFDCHSNETVYPWYSYVAPLSWRIREHVKDGREDLNFSALTPLMESWKTATMVRKDRMPPWDYTLMHPEARLTPAERESFAAGLARTFGENKGAAPQPGAPAAPAAPAPKGDGDDDGD
jgi:mono/diheme cytochrome c family protein